MEPYLMFLKSEMYGLEENEIKTLVNKEQP